MDHIRSIAAPPPPNEDPHPEFLPSLMIDKLCCSICMDVVSSPIKLSCDHTLCSECCCKYIQVTYSLNCPCCFNHILGRATIAAPSDLFMSLLNELVVSCVRGCSRMVKFKDYRQHLDNKCKTHSINYNSPSKVTLKDVLQKSTSTPTTPAELKTAHNLLQRLIHQGEGSSNSTGVIKVPTSGQVYLISIILTL